MASIVERLAKQNLLQAPDFLRSNTMYETIMGSVAYGVSNDMSDVDVYGFCIPPKDVIFPHLAGEIMGFGQQLKRFNEYQQHHIKEASSQREYDVTIYSIVKYFQLCMENNPNMIDSLFTPRRCVLHSTTVGEMVREKRRMFLHKGGWHKYRGYCFAQMSAVKGKRNSSNPKRKELVEKFGFDTKFGGHAVRLLLQIEQIMTEGDLDLERNREIVKSVRKGEWTLDQLDQWVTEKERSLEGLYNTSTLPHGPDQAAIKQLLVDCLEAHYGSLGDAVVIANPARDQNLLAELKALVSKYAEG